MIRLLILALLLIFPGCYTPIKIAATEAGPVNIDSFLRFKFTPEAYEAIKDIPVVQSHLPGFHGGLAAGTNGWSKLASFLMGCGIDRKVVVCEHFLADEDIYRHLIHEYVHHLHDMTLDGEGDWINEEEFRVAYAACAHDTRFAGIVIMVERNANNWFTNTFGINDLSEYIAYTGGHCALKNCPLDLRGVFRKIFRN
jgi:hypothetical protein